MGRKALDSHRMLGKAKATTLKIDDALERYVKSIASGGTNSQGLRACVRKAYRADLLAGELNAEFLNSYMFLHPRLQADIRQYFITHKSRLPEGLTIADPNVTEYELNHMEDDGP